MDVTTEELTEYLKIGFLVSLVFSVVGMVWGYISGAIFENILANMAAGVSTEAIAPLATASVGEVVSTLASNQLSTITGGGTLGLIFALVLFAIGLIIDGWAIKKLAEAGWIKL